MTAVPFECLDHDCRRVFWAGEDAEYCPYCREIAEQIAFEVNL
jgi:hypothetical protein